MVSQSLINKFLVGESLVKAVLIFGQGLPLIWKELSEPAHGMAHDPPEHIIKVLPGIYITRLAGLDKAVAAQQPGHQVHCP